MFEAIDWILTILFLIVLIGGLYATAYFILDAIVRWATGKPSDWP